MQSALTRQINDSRVVNIAGRQRMLSQKLSKETLLIRESKTPEGRAEHGARLAGTLALWQKSRDGLLSGNGELGLEGKNSSKILQMFADIYPSFMAMKTAAQEISEAVKDGSLENSQKIQSAAAVILAHEPAYLKGMDQIVFQYDQEAKSRVKWSKRAEWFILWSALIVLFLEGLFIFRPAVSALGKTLAKLQQALIEILDISEQERRRVAQELHDRLCQEISGISCLTRAFQKKIEAKYAEKFQDLEEVQALIEELLEHTRGVARDLYPITIDGDGLADKLKDLSERTEKIFQVSCRLVSSGSALPVKQDEATHLYCIVQEAILNSIRHGKAKSIQVAMYEKGESVGISIADDGTGFSVPEKEHQGLGLRIMKYRSELISGSLVFSRNAMGGTTVTCEIKPGVKV